MKRIPAYSVMATVAGLAMMACANDSAAQQAPNSNEPAAASGRELAFNKHLDELTQKLDSMRQQLSESQKEMDELRSEIHTLRDQLGERNQDVSAAQDADALRSSVAELKDETGILQAEVQQHDQTKVETLSKYPVRINGAVLFTSVLNSGGADNINVPAVAVGTSVYSPSGSLSATMSQTVLGIDGTGPHIFGAKSRGDLEVDFWGSGNSTAYTSGGGTARLRTAHAELQWPNRTLGVVLDRPLLSPWQPSSWITIGEPALAWSGNLWTWSPQVQYKENRALSTHVNLGMGLIDAPSPAGYIEAAQSGANATEQSRQPGYEARLGGKFSWRDHPTEFGAGGYYSRQSYAYNYHVDAWAATLDWSLPLVDRVTFSGQAYRGRALGGLGGGAFKDYVSRVTARSFRGLDDAGGWAQMKFSLLPSLEVNLSAGLDNAFGNDLEGSDQAAGAGFYETLARNQTVLANFIYRPKSYLLLSSEFRQINSRSIAGQAFQDNVFGLATGYIF